MSFKQLSIHFLIGTILGSVIACSPTRFGKVNTASILCDSSVAKCAVENQFVNIEQDFKIGAGKVDILFVNDNSASMSPIQTELAARFQGFIQNLDNRSIDYRVAVTTTDLNSDSQQKLLPFSTGKFYLTNKDASRVSLFNGAIVRSETIRCEDFIVSMFNTYGTSFQSNSDYARQYSSVCPSPDTRGIYTAHLAVSANAAEFLRSDANLSVILISNDNVRQGQPMEERDTARSFSAMMSSQYPNKYWDFNSIIVKDIACRATQTLKNALGQVVTNQYGPAVSGNIGLEYANLSNSAARDIENNPRPRGKILSICESNYTNHFNLMATQISEDSRLVTLRCTPSAAPEVVSKVGNRQIPHSWNGDKILFQKGNEGIDVSIKYSCYTGPT